MAHTITKTDCEGIFRIQSDIFSDERWYFSEIFLQNFCENMGNPYFVQDNFSVSKKWTFRGLHYQNPHPQAKFLRVISGKILDICLDLRQDSSTFWKIFSYILDSENGDAIFVARGFAHGFLALTDVTVFYKCDDFYDKDADSGINILDKNLDFDLEDICKNFEIDFEDVIISQKDKNLPKFENTKKFF